MAILMEELTEAELEAEANALLLDFRHWMNSHFLFSPRQLAYLLNLSTQTVSFNAQACSYAVRNRLPIILDKQEKPKGFFKAEAANDGLKDEIKKIIKTTNNLTITEDKDETEAGGEVTVSIQFIAPKGGQ